MMTLIEGLTSQGVLLDSGMLKIRKCSGQTTESGISRYHSWHNWSFSETFFYAPWL